MLKQISLSLLFFCALLSLNSKVSPQTPKDIKIDNSQLTGMTLPKGAVSIWCNGQMPPDMNKLLSESFKKYSTIAARGGTEIIVWSGKKANNTDKLTAEIKNDLAVSGWQISGEKQFKNYTELLITKKSRALSAFILPADDVYIFALSELLMLDKTASSPLKKSN